MDAILLEFLISSLAFENAKSKTTNELIKVENEIKVKQMGFKVIKEVWICAQVISTTLCHGYLHKSCIEVTKEL